MIRGRHVRGRDSVEEEQVRENVDEREEQLRYDGADDSNRDGEQANGEHPRGRGEVAELFCRVSVSISHEAVFLPLVLAAFSSKNIAGAPSAASIVEASSVRTEASSRRRTTGSICTAAMSRPCAASGARFRDPRARGGER